MCYLKEVWTIIRSIKYRAEAGTYLKLLENFGLVYHLVCDIKPPNHEFCCPQFFQRIFLSLTSSFSTAYTEKVSWKKLGKTRFVVWWFDVANKIISFNTQSWIYKYFSFYNAVWSIVINSLIFNYCMFH